MLKAWDRLEFYDPAIHHSQICSWLRKRGFEHVIPLEDYPEDGFVVDATACGFLIKTNTRTAIVDYIITNSDANAFARGRAVKNIARQIIATAKNLGFKYIKCDSQIDTIVRLADSLGFNRVGSFQVLSKEL